jgi:hypothetical protein
MADQRRRDGLGIRQAGSGLRPAESFQPLQDQVLGFLPESPECADLAAARRAPEVFGSRDMQFAVQGLYPLRAEAFDLHQFTQGDRGCAL